MKRNQRLSTITKSGHILPGLFAVILALSGFANAESPSVDDSLKEKVVKLTITAPTEIGGVILKPGDYEVKELNSVSGAHSREGVVAKNRDAATCNCDTDPRVQVRVENMMKLSEAQQSHQ